MSMNESFADLVGDDATEAARMRSIEQDERAVWRGARNQKREQTREARQRSEITLGTCARGIEVLEAMRDSLRDSDA